MIYVYRDGKVIPKSEAALNPLAGKRMVGVVSDIEPFQSPVDGSVVGSRSDLRAHNRRNGVIDTGNDTSVLRRRAPYEPTGIGEEIARQMDG